MYNAFVLFQDCGGITELSESNLLVNISSPGYPQSITSDECVWFIKVGLLRTWSLPSQL